LLQLELQLDAFGYYVTRRADLPDRTRSRFATSYENSLSQMEAIGTRVLSPEDRVRLLADPRMVLFKKQLDEALADEKAVDTEVPAVAA
jgi:hypothetical protein